jgi:hypothetical protein
MNNKTYTIVLSPVEARLINERHHDAVIADDLPHVNSDLFKEGDSVVLTWFDTYIRGYSVMRKVGFAMEAVSSIGQKFLERIAGGGATRHDTPWTKEDHAILLERTDAGGGVTIYTDKQNGITWLRTKTDPRGWLMNKNLIEQWKAKYHGVVSYHPDIIAVNRAMDQANIAKSEAVQPKGRGQTSVTTADWNRI